VLTGYHCSTTVQMSCLLLVLVHVACMQPARRSATSATSVPLQCLSPGLTRLVYTPQAAVLGQSSKQLFMVRYSADKQQQQQHVECDL
jgi:hypothetical protein